MNRIYLRLVDLVYISFSLHSWKIFFDDFFVFLRFSLSWKRRPNSEDLRLVICVPWCFHLLIQSALEVFKLRCHILFTHAFSALRFICKVCIVAWLTIVRKYFHAYLYSENAYITRTLNAPTSRLILGKIMILLWTSIPSSFLLSKTTGFRFMVNFVKISRPDATSNFPNTWVGIHKTS